MDLFFPAVSALWWEMKIFEDDAAGDLSWEKEPGGRKQRLGVQSPAHPASEIF